MFNRFNNMTIKTKMFSFLKDLKSLKAFKFKNKTISEIKFKNHIDFSDCLMLSFTLLVSILLIVMGALPEFFLFDHTITTLVFKIITFGFALSVILVGFFTFIREKSKVICSISISFKYAEILIKNKSKQDLEKEIDDLIKNNSFIQHYLHLYKNQFQCFNEIFSNLLKELKMFTNVLT